jgi:hypothetical protein
MKDSVRLIEGQGATAWRAPDGGAEPLEWQLRFRDIAVLVDTAMMRLAVDYSAQIERLSIEPAATLMLTVLAPPLAHLRAVLLDGREASVRVGSENGRCIVDLPRPARPADRITVTARYVLAFDEINPRMAGTSQLHFERDEIVCVAPEWLPRIAHAGGDPNNNPKCPFRLRIECPPEFRVYASGTRREPGHDAASSHVFSDEHALTPSIAFIANTGGAATQPDIVTTIERGSRLMRRWVGDDDAREAFHVVFYSGDRCLGLGPLLLIGRFFDGAEPSIDRLVMGVASLREVLLHELAHRWFGGIVTGTGADGRLLHEGLASHFGGRLMGALCGPAEMEVMRRRRLERYRAVCRMVADGTYDPEQGDRSDWFALRGAVIMDLLRDRVGSCRFDGAIRTLVERHRGGYFGLADLAAAFETRPGEVAQFLGDWLHGVPRMPPDSVD